MIKRILIVIAVFVATAAGFAPVAGASVLAPSVAPGASTGLTVGADMYHHG